MNQYRITDISGLVDQELDWPDIPKKTVSEGNIDFFVADAESIYDAPVFFNPDMVLNRDLAILFSKLYADRYTSPIRFFEPLAGMGIRAFRLAKQLKDDISEIVICDFNEVTTAVASYNIHQLDIQEKIFQFKRESKALATDLAEKQLRYHIVDLDPFGSPSPFIDTIWGVFPTNGLAAITATDMTVLCGVYPDACLRKYGAKPLNNQHTHETAARILIAMIARSAARQERGIEPIVTASVDHYTKTFVKTRKSRGAANEAVKQIGVSYTCKGCQEIYYLKINDSPPKCCGELDMAGPLWIGDLFQTEWCTEGLNILPQLSLPSTRRIEKILLEGKESQGLLGYYDIPLFCKNMKNTQPAMNTLLESIKTAGYRAVRSAFNKQAIRTDIPGIELQKLVENLTEHAGD